jgi:hypothetical protein
MLGNPATPAASGEVENGKFILVGEITRAAVAKYLHRTTQTLVNWEQAKKTPGGISWPGGEKRGNAVYYPAGEIVPAIVAMMPYHDPKNNHQIWKELLELQRN